MVYTERAPRRQQFHVALGMSRTDTQVLMTHLFPHSFDQPRAYSVSVHHSIIFLFNVHSVHCSVQHSVSSLFCSTFIQFTVLFSIQSVRCFVQHSVSSLFCSTFIQFTVLFNIQSVRWSNSVQHSISSLV